MNIAICIIDYHITQRKWGVWSATLPGQYLVTHSKLSTTSAGKSTCDPNFRPQNFDGVKSYVYCRIVTILFDIPRPVVTIYMLKQ